MKVMAVQEILTDAHTYRQTLWRLQAHCKQTKQKMIPADEISPSYCPNE